MKLHVDLETLQLIEGPGFRNPLGSLRFKRGDATRLEVVFLTNGTTVAPIGDPALLELRFGIKPRNRYDVGYLVHTDAWTMPAPDAETPVYQCSPSFNTTELNSALGVGSSTGSELAEITLMGEITWREGAGEPTSTRTFLVVVENDVNRGTEGVPQSAQPAYPAPAGIELLARKGQPNGYAELDAEGRIPVLRVPLPEGIELTGSGVAIGINTAVKDGASVFGALAAGHGVSLGYQSLSQSAAVAIGGNSQAMSHGIAIGSEAHTASPYCIAIGFGASAGDIENGAGRLEIAPAGCSGPRISGHQFAGINVMQFTFTDGHGMTPIAHHGGAVFDHAPGTLPPGMMMFAYASGNLTIYLNDAGTLKTTTLQMS